MHSTRRTLLQSAGALFGLGLLSRPTRAAPLRRRNLLIISSDEHRHDAMSCAGHPVLQTPNMDRLAAQGVRLENANAAAPICAPARQSLLTGLMPSEHGQLGNGFVFAREHPTLFELARDAGVDTAGFGKLHTNNGLEDYAACHGLERFDSGETSPIWYVTALQAALKGPTPPGRPDPQDAAVFARLRERDHRFWGLPLDDPSLLPDERIADLAELSLRTAPRDQPWLRYVSFRQPHHYWTLPTANYYRYHPRIVDLPRVPTASTPTDQRIAERHGWDRFTEEELRLCRARYYGGVDYIDQQVGRLMAVLEELGLSEDTVVAYISDHGEQLGEHGQWFKGNMRGGSLRIPVIVRAPGLLPSGGVDPILLNQVDLLPTLYGLAGWRLPEALPGGRPTTGRDLSRALMGRQPGPELSFAMYPDGRGVRLSMVQSARYKLIRDHSNHRIGPQWSLYDLQQDPLETRDLGLEHPQAADLQLALLDWLETRQAPAFPLQRVGAG